MSNFIRACFCINEPVPDTSFVNLFQKLDLLGCTYNVWQVGTISGHVLSTAQNLLIKEAERDSQSDFAKLGQIAEWLSQPGYVDISLAWTLNNGFCYEARIGQRWPDKAQPRALSFGIEATVFLPGATLEFTPDTNIPFENFKQILVELVRSLKPFLGAIDYEADLECFPVKQYGSFVSWGNYFSYSILEQWPQNDQEALLQIPHESLRIEQLGVLIFIHPLTVNQAWTNHHKEMQSLINRNMPIN